MAKNSKDKQGLVWMVVIFMVVALGAFIGRNYLEARGADVNVILIGNLILFVLAVFTFRRSLKAIDDPNPHVFVRHFYAGFLIRLAVIAVTAFLYIYSKDGNVNRVALFVCLGIYALYSIIEVSGLRSVLNQRKNA